MASGGASTAKSTRVTATTQLMTRS
jgi:hypothetical protein